MDGFKAHLARFFLRPNPYRAGASDQRKWIVAHDFGGAFDFELDRIIRKRPNCAELVGNPQNYAGRVRTIGC